MAILSNYYWVHRREVNADVLKAQLTKFPVVYRGTPDPVECFAVDGDYIGVPRIWGLNRMEFHVDDQTVAPRVKWDTPKDFTYRTGQYEAINWVADRFNEGKYGAILNAPTGVGKSTMGLMSACVLDIATLVCVHKDDLVDQWIKLYHKLFNKQAGKIKQNEWDYKGRNLVVASTQTLFSRLDQIPDDFTKQFGLVIFDEVPLFPARTFSKVLNHFPARFRLGLTATLRRRDGFGFMWDWCIGSFVYKMQGEIHPTKYCQTVIPASFSDSHCYHYGKLSHTKFIEKVTTFHGYNKWIVDNVVLAVNAGRKPIVLSDRVDHLVQLAAAFKDRSNASCGLYVGAIDGKTLTKKQLDKAAQSQVLFATYQKGGIGTDIPELDTAILATPRKDVEQAIGRIRRPLPDKKLALVVDPVIDTPYGRGLGIARAKQYRRLGIDQQ